jgi:hypothetical protein
MTRAFALLWRGRLGEAIESNPASPFVFATLLTLAVQPWLRNRRSAGSPAATAA